MLILLYVWTCKSGDLNCLCAPVHREQVEGAEEYRDDQVSQIQVSRWSKYLNPPEEVNPEEEDVLIERLEPNDNNMSNR